MKSKEKKPIFGEVLLNPSGQESSHRDVLIERLKVESYFSPGEVRFVESTHSSN